MGFLLNMKVNISPDLEGDLRSHSQDMIKEDFVDKVIYMAKHESPKLTGNNRDSIVAKKASGGIGGFGWKIGTTSRYGGFLELGTAKMPARPYFAPSIKNAFEIMKEKYG